MVQQDSSRSPLPRFPVKKIGRFSDALALCCVDFPIYYIEAISERHIVIAGGGGSSKTGVQNQINVLELIPTDGSCAAELMTKYQTPKEIPDAIMTGALVRDSPLTDTRLVTAGSNNAIIYDLNFEVARCCYKISCYELLKSSKVEAEIKSVKYAPGGRVFTGGIDGQLTVWNIDYNTEDKVEKSLKAHAKEIDEIDINPVNGQIVTLSRGECRFVIWDLYSYKAIKQFKKEDINEKTSALNSSSNLNFNYRSCRFAYDSTSPEPNDCCLLVACNPMPSKGPSLIYTWTTKNAEFKRLNCKPVTIDGIMSMDISKDGKYVAIGTRSGGVAMFDVRSMHQIYKLNDAHHNAITGLEFLPSKQESLMLTNSQINPFFSVSIDRQVILHRPRRGSILLKSVKILLLAMMIILAFVFMHDYYLNDPAMLFQNETSVADSQDKENNSVNISL